jgi:Aerotolerance regulator N-terminal/von Willebrand factor type A domain
MSLLFPLFFAAAAAITVPILLHLLRQRARNSQLFSSLMFLRPSVPRVRPKTRVENLLLLLLRCLALILLALAFSRPFWNESDFLTASQGGRTLILVDTSASMNRAGLWTQAQDLVTQTIAQAAPNERLAVVGFDRSLRLVVDFEPWSKQPALSRQTYAQTLVKHLTPGNSGTDLGAALTRAIELLSDDEAAVGDDKSPKRLVLISDLQSGRGLDALRNTNWPEGLELTISSVKSSQPTNAGLSLVSPAQGLAPELGDQRQRVRVTNDSHSTSQAFEIAWSDGIGAPVSVTVPPGNARVVRAPARPPGQPGYALILRGDDHGFDNTLYVTADTPADAPVLYFGDDQIDDPNGLAYFLVHALQPTRALAPRITAKNLNQPIEEMSRFNWVVVSGTPSAAVAEQLADYSKKGGSLMAVLRQASDAAWLGQLSGTSITAEEAQVTGYALIGRVDFTHPLLRPFELAQFGDFSKIHVWHYRKVTPPKTAKVMAWYDDHQPAWFELNVGEGRCLIMTSGWHPADSQLALSTKFVPLIYTELQRSGKMTPRLNQVIIGDTSTIPAEVTSVIGPLTATELKNSYTPTTNQLAAQPTNAAHANALPLGVTNQLITPGIYRLQTTSGPVIVAANVDPTESHTAPIELETLEALGVNIAHANSAYARPATANSAATSPALAVEAIEAAEATLAKRRLLKVTEVEGQQKLWLWILAGVLGLLILESLIAGRAKNISKTSTTPPVVSTGATS